MKFYGTSVQIRSSVRYAPKPRRFPVIWAVLFAVVCIGVVVGGVVLAVGRW